MASDNQLNLLHFVRLSGFGGVQWQFSAFAKHSASEYGIDHSVIACSKTIHPFIRKTIRESCGLVRLENRVGGVRIPKALPALREAYKRRMLRQSAPDVILLWDRVEPLRSMSAADMRRCIYWERGASWAYSDDEEERKALINRVPCALANSHAAKRILQQRWQFNGDIAVCLNAVRPIIAAGDAPAKSLPQQRPIRIGVAAQFVPFKAVHVAIHTVHALRHAGHDVHLHLAGDGRERAALENLVHQLSITEVVWFHGFVEDMASFYSKVDCLLHCSISEPFGGVLVEAMFYGCPIFCAAVDGMAEIVTDGVEGRLLAPTLPITDNQSLGAAMTHLPPFVYHPETDAIGPARLVDPHEAAKAIGQVLASPERFREMSAAAMTTARQRFAYSRHAREVNDALQRFKRLGSVSAP